MKPVIWAALAAGLVAFLPWAGSADAQECKLADPPSATDLKDMRTSARPMEASVKSLPGGMPVLSSRGQPDPTVVGGARPGKSAPSPADDADTRNYGHSNFDTIFHYSDMRVSEYAVPTYPYSTIGKLSFKRRGESFECTAALISNSILVTAGHCVYDDKTAAKRKWNTTGVFTPAVGNNFGPFGNATVSHFCTGANWLANGEYFAGNDVAVVVLRKKTDDTNEIGSYTGTLGFCSENCTWKYNQLTQIGYPANYDGGNLMQMGQHLETFPFKDGAGNTIQDYGFGSGMQAGSSGGPHIANFGPLNDSAPNLGQWTHRNIVFAVTSWGVEIKNPGQKMQGASPLSGPGNSNQFKVLFNLACEKARKAHGKKSCAMI